MNDLIAKVQQMRCAAVVACFVAFMPQFSLAQSTGSPNATPRPTDTPRPTPTPYASSRTKQRQLQSLSKRSSRVFDAVIQVQATSVTAGTSFVIKVGLLNTGSQSEGIIQAAPWQTVALRVIRPDGAELRAQAPDLQNYASAHSTSVAPGQTYYASWSGTQWWSIDHWGYHLSTPGRYTLIINPTPHGAFVYDASGRESRIAVTVLPGR